MNVPLLDLRAQLTPIRDEILAAVTEVVDSGRYILGPKVEAFEREMANYVGTRHAVGVSSGTDALLIALMVMNIGPGDQVVTTPFSFFATAGVISRVGASPVFVDIDPETFNIDPASLRRLPSSERIKAVMPVHLYGQCADMEPILGLARDRGWHVIEDAAQAVGAEYPTPDGVKKAGSMGTMGAFSFFPSKNLGCLGDGGLVTTDDGEVYEKLVMFRTHGAKPKYYHRYVGGNFRIDPLQTAVLSVKLPYLDDWHLSRMENAARYDALFASSKPAEEGAIALPKKAWEGNGLRHPHIYNQYVIRVRGDQRDALKKYLGEAGVGTEIYYPVPFHMQECFRYLGYREGDFPEAEAACREVLALPVYPELTREMQEYVVDRIASFFG